MVVEPPCDPAGGRRSDGLQVYGAKGSTGMAPPRPGPRRQDRSMNALEPLVFACSCEGTMPLDEAALARGCGGALHTADQLCRRELDRFRRAVAAGAAVTVGCTQEAPLFSEVAGESGAAERVRFA